MLQCRSTYINNICFYVALDILKMSCTSKKKFFLNLIFLLKKLRFWSNVTLHRKDYSEHMHIYFQRNLLQVNNQMQSLLPAAKKRMYWVKRASSSSYWMRASSKRPSISNIKANSSWNSNIRCWRHEQTTNRPRKQEQYGPLPKIFGKRSDISKCTFMVWQKFYRCYLKPAKNKLYQKNWFKWI